ncbi:MAG TPA: efflux transporter outer membrane subunit [Steroidobacteraceae bacterium]|nr:efflux transporter outer membrane subunit [Steroidobacteraceae bacterium]
MRRLACPRAAGVRRTAALAAALLAGCAVGPNYHRPPAPVPEAYKETPPGWKLGSPQDALDRGEWWHIFADPELDGLEGQVDISNQNVKQYEAQYREAAALLREAEAQLFPVMSASFGGQRGGGGGGTAAVSSAVGSGTGGSTHTEFTLEGVLTWQPDIWGTIRRQVESRKAGVQVSEANLASARLSAQATLATDYFDLRATDSLRTLLTRAAGLDQRALEIAQNQLRSGTATSGDVAAARSALEATQAQLIGVEQQRGTYEHAIAMLSGHLPSEVSIAAAPLKATVPQVPLTLPSQLLERNPAIAAAERQMKQENALIGVAIGAYFPTISLSALGGYAGNPLSTLIHAGNRIWSVGGTASDTLLQGGEQVAAVAQARATYDQYVASYRQTVLSTFQSVEDQLLALRVLEREAAVEQKAVGDAQTAVNVALNQFNAGTVSYTTVITDIQSLIADQQALLTIQQNQLVAVVSLIEALGGGWDASRL